MRKRKNRWIVPAAIAAAVLALIALYGVRGKNSQGPVLRFCGAAREVGGSCHLVEAGDVSFIVDCGAMGEAGRGILPPQPSGLSFVILTHAHLDHCGMLPELYASGFIGKVYCTEPTAGLVPVMLRMTRSISTGEVPRADFDRALEGLTSVHFGEVVDLEHVSFRFGRAGHLLGAAFVEVWVGKGEGCVKLVFSGDLGSGGSLLLPPHEGPEDADYVIMESTYGGTVRRVAGDSPADRHRFFAEAVGEAIDRGGDVLVPAFTLGRTQEVIAVIDLFSRSGVIPPGVEVYVDSPTALKITDIYRKFPDELSSWAREFYGREILKTPSLREVRSRVSLKVHERKHSPSIFVSSSGDLDHANSPRHLIRMFDDPRNLLCIVGWQSRGSLGSRLAAGESPVLVRYREGRSSKSEWIAPDLEVRFFDSFSGHADQRGLLEWLGGIRGVKRVFLVHGEVDQAKVLAGLIESDLGFDVDIPKRGDRVILETGEGLSGSGSVDRKAPGMRACGGVVGRSGEISVSTANSGAIQEHRR